MLHKFHRSLMAVKNNINGFIILYWHLQGCQVINFYNLVNSIINEFFNHALTVILMHILFLLICY